MTEFEKSKAEYLNKVQYTKKMNKIQAVKFKTISDVVSKYQKPAAKEEIVVDQKEEAKYYLEDKAFNLN